MNFFYELGGVTYPHLADEVGIGVFVLLLVVAFVGAVVAVLAVAGLASQWAAVLGIWAHTAEEYWPGRGGYRQTFGSWQNTLVGGDDGWPTSWRGQMITAAALATALPAALVFGVEFEVLAAAAYTFLLADAVQHLAFFVWHLARAVSRGELVFEEVYNPGLATAVLFYLPYGLLHFEEILAHPAVWSVALVIPATWAIGRWRVRRHYEAERWA